MTYNRVTQRAVSFYGQATLGIQSWYNDRIFLIRRKPSWRYFLLVLEHSNFQRFLKDVYYSQNIDDFKWHAVIKILQRKEKHLLLLAISASAI